MSAVRGYPENMYTSHGGGSWKMSWWRIHIFWIAPIIKQLNQSRKYWKKLNSRSGYSLFDLSKTFVKTGIIVVTYLFWQNICGFGFSDHQKKFYLTYLGIEIVTCNVHVYYWKKFCDAFCICKTKMKQFCLNLFSRVFTCRSIAFFGLLLF